MLTKRLFRNDVFKTVADCHVSRIENNKYGDCLILDETVFFPEGGGQSSDTGIIDNYPVEYVFETEDEIFHVLKNYDGKLSGGDTVHCEINWSRRFDNMQRHCGEHILSGVIHKLYGGVNRGFHMGEDYMTIDISLEDRPEFTELTFDMLKKAEYEVNHIIWENMPVITRHFDTLEEAKDLPLRKKLNIDKDITIVSVGDTDDPSDCVACCGTHPDFTGSIGMIKIYKVEPNKGMFRIYLEAGERAWLRYRDQYDTLLELERRLSANDDDVIEKFEANERRHKETKDRLVRLSKALTDKLSEEIIKEASKNENRTIDSDSKKNTNSIENMLFREYKILSIDDILNIGKKAAPQISGMLIALHNPSNTVLLFSEVSHCGNIVKEYRKEHNCKGGGGSNNARAVFDDADNAADFISFLKH